jgi:hypothetical protein
MKHVINGTELSNGEKPGKKFNRGRKPKANPQKYRHSVRLNNKEKERFLSLYKQSGKQSISAFMAYAVLEKPMKIIEINKSLIDFTMLLSELFVQFRGIKNNYNQCFSTLKKQLGEEKARSFMKIVEKPTLEFIQLKQQIEKTYTKFRELCLPK